LKKYLTILLLIPILTYSQYVGGIGAGYKSLENTNIYLASNDGQYEGGNGSGTSSRTLKNIILSDSDGQYEGGNGIGAVNFNIFNIVLSESNGKYEGGISTGHDIIELKKITLALCDGTSNTWNGNTSTAWSIYRNWSCGAVPTSTTTVTIPAGLLNYPILGSQVSIKHLIMETNTTINLIGIGRLTVTGQ
jgi:hypothetical protein